MGDDTLGDLPDDINNVDWMIFAHTHVFTHYKTYLYDCLLSALLLTYDILIPKMVLVPEVNIMVI